MPPFLSWYLLVSILGWLTFPLTFRLFPALTDRGFTLARTAGLLIWGYLFWMLASLGIAQNDLGGMLLALAILIGLSVWSLVNHRSEIVNFLRSNLALILGTEILFLIAFGFLAFLRSANPELTSTEKPMELAFISAIMRSPTFPPQDPWLSGYAISYYYFGYVMTAMLAVVTNVPSSMAHNLMTSLIFGLGAVGSFGIVYNLLTIDRGRQTTDDEPVQIVNRQSKIVSALLAPLFLLLISNFEALLEVFHRAGFFWQKNAETGVWTGAFWKWLDMKELSQPPLEPFAFVPDRYLWWWRASRVIQDYDMAGGFREVIDEFPFFSFLLGDLHPHVLAIPFGLLAIAVALNFFLGGSRGEINLFGYRLHVRIESFIFSALIIGGLSFLNTWDILVAGTLIVFSYVIWRASEDGWRWDRIEDMLLFGLPLGIVSVLMYLPFYIGFSSQAGGILPNQMFVTRGMHLWVMWGTLFIPIFAYLIHLTFGVQELAPADGDVSKPRPNWLLGISVGFGIVIFLWLFSLLLAWIASFVEKDFIIAFLASQGMNASEFLLATTLRRLNHIGSLITLLFLLIPAIAFLFPKRTTIDDRPQTVDNDQPSTINHQPITDHRFVLLLAVLATLLILAPEFVYLRDQFGYRINTVFKFYYQAWMLFSIVAAFAVAYLLDALRGFKDIAFRILIGLVIFAGLLYPVFGAFTKTNNFEPVGGFTLDDFDRVVRENPDEAAAISFLRTAPDGVVAEAVGDGYSAYARISMFTGLQTVLGWPGHEGQWRGSYAPQGTRREDINKLYTTARWDEAQAIIEKYNIRYIYIGNLERMSMPVNEEKFKTYLKVVFPQGDAPPGSAIIYEVP